MQSMELIGDQKINLLNDGKEDDSDEQKENEEVDFDEWGRKNEELNSFIEACMQNNLEKVVELVESGVNISERLYNCDFTGLGHAISKGNIEIVKYLVEKGANIEQSGCCDGTALFTAADFDQREIAEYLVSKGAFLNPSHVIDGSYLTIWCISEGNSVGHFLKCELIKCFYNITKSFKIDGSNSSQILDCLNESIADRYSNEIDYFNLFYEIKFNKSKDLEKLREQHVLQYFITTEFKEKFKKLFIESTSNEKKLFQCALNRFIRYFKAYNHLMSYPSYQTPVKYSYKRLKKMAMERTLIDSVLDDKSESTKTDLIESIISHLNQVISSLTKKIKRSKIFFHFINQPKMQQFLAKHSESEETKNESKPDEHQDNKEQTELMRICQDSNVNLQIVKEFVEKGANLNAQDNRGKTALFYILGHNKELVEYLIDSGADVNIVDKENQSALTIACQHGSLDIIKLVIEKGADIYVENKQNENLIEVALKKSQNGYEICKLLIENGISIHQKNAFGQSLLCLAISNCCQQLVEYLLQKGININELDEYGETALFHAVYKNSMIDFLISKGADVNVQNNEGKTVLLQAIEIYNSRNDRQRDFVINSVLKTGVNLNLRDNCGMNFFSLVLPSFIELKESTNVRKEFILNLYDSFQYVDIDEFRQKVIDSIDNENLFPITWNHIVTFSYLFANWHDELNSCYDAYVQELRLRGIWTFFGDYKFKEKLIEDVINNLKDQQETLRIEKAKISAEFSKFKKDEFIRESFDEASYLEYLE